MGDIDQIVGLWRRMTPKERRALLTALNQMVSLSGQQLCPWPAKELTDAQSDQEAAK